MATKMKAQVFYEKEKMVLEEIDIPEISSVDVLIKVKNVGICGSDVSYYYGQSPVGTETGKGPIVLGHEFTGEVVKVGKIPADIGLFKDGDRVVITPVQHCNACYSCAAGHTNVCENIKVPGVTQNGGFAEYCASNYTGLFKLPDSISYAAGAFIEPLACAVYALTKLDLIPGQSVVIFGPGPIGIMMVQLVKAAGAGRIILVGTNDFRLELGKKNGADYIFNIKNNKSKYYSDNLKDSVSKLTNGRLAERVLVPTSSNEAFEEAVEIGGNSSIILHFGLPNENDVMKIPALKFHTMDKEIRSSWLAPMVWPTTIRMVEEGLIKTDSLLTHTYNLEETEKAIINIKNRIDNPLKAQIVM